MPLGENDVITARTDFGEAQLPDHALGWLETPQPRRRDLSVGCGRAVGHGLWTLIGIDHEVDRSAFFGRGFCLGVLR